MARGLTLGKIKTNMNYNQPVNVFQAWLDSAKRSELASASQQINKRDARLDASGNNRSTDIKIEDFDIAFGERY